MNPKIERFLRNSHVYARLVETILERAYLERATKDGLTFEQLNVLKFIQRRKQCRIKDVQGFLNASFAAASFMVSRLRKSKLVACTRSKADRRAELVEVTAKGRSMIQKYETFKETRLKKALGGKDLDAMSQSLEEAIAVLMSERSVASYPCLGCGVYYTRQCVVRSHGQSCPCD